MSSKDKGRELATKVSNRFLVPLDASNGRIERIAASLPPELSEIAKVFAQNVSAVVSTVAIPVTLASTAAHSSHWQRIHSAERIRSLMLEQEEEEDKEALERRRQRHALESASKKLEDFLASQDGMDRVAHDTCAFLLEAIQSDELSAAADELLLQGTVLTWSAFENLCRDVFVAMLNASPAKVHDLLREPSIRQRLRTKLSLEELAEYGFDLSQSLGHVLSAQQDFSDLRTIKATLVPAIGGGSEVVGALAAKELWLLCQQRHIILHRRGIVDDRYVSATGEEAVVGSRLIVRPSELEARLESVIAAGLEILDCAGKHAA